MKRFGLLSGVVTALFTLATSAYLGAADDSTAKKDPEAKIKAVLAKLSEADRKLAEAQRYCAAETENRLGSMGAPVKVEVEGKPVFLCCAGCKEGALADPKATLAEVEKLKKITAALGKLKEKDRVLAEQQQFCPVMEDSRLGSMGAPVAIEIKGKTVFLCCKGCKDEALADPAATLKKVESLKTASAKR
jgi:3-deoxy-D-arabino-heptulosonate 7-phosphate (DAHP) synthase class II